MRKLLFLALVLISLPGTVKSQNSFTEAISTLEKNPIASIDDLIAIVSDPAYAQFLNPKAKTGYKNLQRVINLSISYADKDWLKPENCSRILDSFADQGMDFSISGKEAVSSNLLQEYVFDYNYNYQNVGLIIYREILKRGYDPFHLPDKKGKSMFGFAIEQTESGSYYLDEVIKAYNMNSSNESLRMSPFIWLTSNPTTENIVALKHLILYDTNLNINERFDDGKTSAFDRAVALTNTDLAMVLIEGGIDLEATCQSCASENYLHRIALYNSIDVFNMIPANIVEQLINQPDINGKSPIFWALENENAELAISFANAGADLALKNNDGISVMQVANQYAEANHAFILIGREIMDR